jgi:hypothetical protein
MECIVTIPHTLGNLQEGIKSAVCSTSPSEIKCAMKNVFVTCDQLWETEGNHG